MKNELKTLAFPFEVKETSEDGNIGIIEGYASTFGNIDYGLDVVDKGAFTKTLKENGQKFPILADHDSYKQIGYNVSAKEDDVGLLVKGEVNLDTQLGRERMSLAKQAQRLKTKMGLSIGYMTIKSEPDSKNPMIRRLKELRLFEYSFVTFPMNDKAAITAAKSLEGIDKINFVLDHLKEIGVSVKDLELALRLKEAAEKENNPTLISQSFELALKNFSLN